jgi:hypothetical protein
MNYFPRPEPIAELQLDPRCSLIHGVQPENQALGYLEGEFSSAIRAFWQRYTSAKPLLIVLFDVSDSMGQARGALWNHLLAMLSGRVDAFMPESRVLLFGGDVVGEGSLDDCLDGEFMPHASDISTSFEAALGAALTRSFVAATTEIWMFTDGQGNISVDDWSAEFMKARCHLHVWETGSNAGNSDLAKLAEMVGGTYRSVP